MKSLVNKIIKVNKGAMFSKDLKYSFIRIGKGNGVWQTNKVAPAKRGIWALPKIAGVHELLFVGMAFQKENPKDLRSHAHKAAISKEDYNHNDVIKELKNRNLIKTIHLSPIDEIWHRFVDRSDQRWIKTSVREYWKRLKKYLGGYKNRSRFFGDNDLIIYPRRFFRDGEIMEIFIED